MSDPEPTYPSAEELMEELGPERIDFMRSMIGDIKYKPGHGPNEEDDEGEPPSN